MHFLCVLKQQKSIIVKQYVQACNNNFSNTNKNIIMKV